MIDTHMHLWNRANGYEWLDEFPALNHNFEMKEYRELSRHQPISQMVHIECGGFPANRVLETKWVQEQADRYGGPQAIIAFAQLDDPHVETVLKGHLQYPNLRGIRMPLNYVESGFGAGRDDYMQDSSWRKGFARLAKHRLLFEMQIFDPQIPQAAQLAKDFPDTLIILEHLGWPSQTSLDYFPQWKATLAQLAACPNLFLKISGIGWIFQDNEDLTVKYLREAVRLFGVDRCVVGSNCPPDLLYLGFDEIFRIFKTAFSIYSEIDQKKIMHDNAKRIYRI
jgi:predicted TIM-barrel fold metal-dependent hydrolase